MQHFVVFVRPTIFYLTLFGAFSFCCSAEEVTESSKTQEKQKADKPKLAGDVAKSATVPNASDKPVVTKHSIAVGDSELAYSAETDNSMPHFKTWPFSTHPEWGSQSLVGRLRIHLYPADTNGENRLYFWRREYPRQESQVLKHGEKFSGHQKAKHRITRNTY